MFVVRVSFYDTRTWLVILLFLELCAARAHPQPTKPVAKRKIFVMGADRLLGKAVVFALSKNACAIQGGVDITAGVSDIVKAKKLKELQTAKIVKAEFGTNGLRGLFRGVDVIYLSSPEGPERVSLVNKTATLAKEAGVRHIILHSLSAAENSSTILGAEYQAIEAAVSSLGVPVTVLRLTLYMENFMAFSPSIKADSRIYWPVNPSKQFTPVAISDAAKAGATLLCDALSSSAQHIRKTYTIASGRFTFENVSEEFGKQLGRPIIYEHISYSDAAELLQQHAFSERYANAILELQKLIDQGSPIVNQNNTGDFEKLTKTKPTSLAQWVAGVKDLLQ